jgi:hypothetical protein
MEFQQSALMVRESITRGEFSPRYEKFENTCMRGKHTFIWNPSDKWIHALNFSLSPLFKPAV